MSLDLEDLAELPAVLQLLYRVPTTVGLRRFVFSDGGSWETNRGCGGRAKAETVSAQPERPQPLDVVELSKNQPSAPLGLAARD